MAVLPFASLAGFDVMTAAQHKTSPHKQLGAASPGIHCGTKRWTIETHADADASRVAAVAPVAPLVSDLTLQSAPKRLLQNSRIASGANEQVGVRTLLIAWKEEAGARGDHDFHTLIADPKDHSKTIIPEIPSLDCASACSSMSAKDFKAGRDVLTTEFGTAPQSTSVTPAVSRRIVEVTAVSFDFDHGQDGLASNCIQIHRVLNIVVQAKRGNTAVPLPSGVSHTCTNTGTADSGGVTMRPRLTIEEAGRCSNFQTRADESF